MCYIISHTLRGIAGNQGSYIRKINVGQVLYINEFMRFWCIRNSDYPYKLQIYTSPFSSGQKIKYNPKFIPLISYHICVTRLYKTKEEMEQDSNEIIHKQKLLLDFLDKREADILNNKN